ncbi:MAG TPA: FAD-dependent oxidoreductase [Candidatus Deferrimicrobiaceae bacterium]|jgi:NADPH-dependent glutamate synthase beta subunit-like oxidoreductase
MDFLRPENLLRYGYKDCLLCEVDRKGEEKRCRRCGGRVGQRDRLLWEINRERIRRNAATLSRFWPGAGHIYSGRYGIGFFWAILIPLALGLMVNVWQGPSIRSAFRMMGHGAAGKAFLDVWHAATYGHFVLILAFCYIWYLARKDAARGFKTILAPCQAACPSGVDIPDYLALVREGHPVEALALVHDKLPFAAFCGRACPHPCEQKCVRNEWNAPISIMQIKRFAADRGYAAGVAPSNEIVDGIPSPRIAVIGAGPAGLSAANTLARLGCKVTVYDENEEPGGTIRYGVTDFRFPYEALLSDVRAILARGVHFQGGRKFGADLSFPDLAREGFDAMLIAVGTNAAIRLPGTGGENEGFHDALTFLAKVKRKEPVRLQGKVVIIGGGAVAIDVARTVVRLGAPDVTITCLESRETMPAFKWEVEEALDEGIKLLPGTASKKFLMRDGRVCGFEALQVERIDLDPKGRILPRTIPGSEFEVGADVVIMAIGSRPAMEFLPAGSSRRLVDPGHHVYQLISTGKDSTIPAYMCGDCVRGPATVVEASASGRAAALNIYGGLCVSEVKKARFEDNYRRLPEPQVTDRPEWRVRLHGPKLMAEESRCTFEEVEKGFTEESVRREAERCARCNLWL